MMILNHNVLDANNLCRWAMSKPLPTCGFEWMNEEELENWKNHSCILEVGLVYRKDLHDLHNDYPLSPERSILRQAEGLRFDSRSRRPIYMCSVSYNMK